MINKTNRALIVYIFICWFFLLMYPNPLLLGKSLYRIFYPPLDTQAVEDLLPEVPEEAALIEAFVMDKIPYSYDWQTYQVPWYFPTLEEVLEQQKGDCKSRFTVLASILTARGIPYEHRLSPTHIWVDYPGKTPTPLENEAVTFFADDGETRNWQLPAINLQDLYRGTKLAYWDAMPSSRKTNLLLGIAGTALFYALAGRREDSAPALMRKQKK